MIDAVDWAIARWDMGHFARAFLGVDMHPGQSRFADAVLLRDASGWRPAYLDIDVSAGNRAGKTLGLSIVIAHSCLFKVGRKPPGGDERSITDWMRAPYEWWHFGIKQEVADLVHHELVMLFAGVHPAQKGRGCPFAEQAEAPVADFDTKDHGTWPVVQFNPLLGGAVVRFRTTSGQQGTSALGRDMHGISFDEAGFEEHLPYIVDEVLHFRRLGTGGQLILISTPTAGVTDFADHWEEGNPENPNRKPGRISLRMSTRENVGFGIDQEIFDRLVADMTPDLIPQNIDGFFIRGDDAYFHAPSIERVFDLALPAERPGQKGRVYVQGVDPGSKDRTWSFVFDVTWRPSAVDPNRDDPYLDGMKCSASAGRLSTPELVAMVVTDYEAYAQNGRAVVDVGVDSTGHGGHMWREAMEVSIPFVQSIEFGGSSARKRELLNDLRTMMDMGRLRMPLASEDWQEARRQLRRYKLADHRLETDAVMALAVAVRVAKRARPMTTAGVGFDLRWGEPSVTPGDDWLDQPYRHGPRSVKRATMTPA